MAATKRSRAWQRYDVSTRSDGSAAVSISSASTQGEDGEVERRRSSIEFKSVGDALACTGGSRISASGVVVTVRVDGEEHVS